MSDTGDPVWVCRKILIQKNTKTVQLIKYKMYRFFGSKLLFHIIYLSYYFSLYTTISEKLVLCRVVRNFSGIKFHKKETSAFAFIFI